MVVSVMEKENKPHNEKTCLQGFRSGLTPTGFTAIDRWRLEISDLGSRGIVLSSENKGADQQVFAQHSSECNLLNVSQPHYCWVPIISKPCYIESKRQLSNLNYYLGSSTHPSFKTQSLDVKTMLYKDIQANKKHYTNFSHFM